MIMLKIDYYINLNYDTISISREVYSDGLNKYVLNGGEVRLKDINNLLASVNIGSSGHHIISQGEADRILNASSKDRREMIEDALGLKIYQYKIKEAERKLERTTNNMKEVSLLRKENAPHINFLKKQVEKFEKAKEMKVDLLNFYREYLKKEAVYLEKEKHSLNAERNKIQNEIADINQKISSTEDISPIISSPQNEELKNLENKLREIRNVKGELDRKLGRIEGMIEMGEKQVEKPVRSENVSIHREELEAFFKEINEYLEEAIYMDVLENIAPVLGKVKDILNRFARNFGEENYSVKNNSSQVEELKNTQNAVLAEIEKIKLEENKILDIIEDLKKEINKEIEEKREGEREKFTLRVRHQELSSILQMISVKEESIKRENENFENEIKEGAALIGGDVFSYRDFEFEGGIDRNNQEEVRRKIERIKIKLEDAGAGGGSEVLKEFEEITERDRFLAKEMEDLEVSILSLRKLMADLKEKIDIEFKEGIKKINVEFQELFALMFGGGTAHLSIIVESKKIKNEEDEESDPEEDKNIPLEQGIEIGVSLPHKKVKELHSLSGGERSLTSIALLFAMSQVNPPPFLVLDETDAALDEANSRKYGDMLEKLSKRSQLIVVTHNRETMSRAGVLYGVTIGADGASKLLSVKFDEATAIAK